MICVVGGNKRATTRHVVSPFQGSNWINVRFPGLCPGLSHSAPLGPVICVINFMPVGYGGYRPARSDTACLLRSLRC
jgi:hypothetical protein